MILFFGPTVDPKARPIFSIGTSDETRYLRRMAASKALVVCKANLCNQTVISSFHFFGSLPLAYAIPWPCAEWSVCERMSS